MTPDQISQLAKLLFNFPCHTEEKDGILSLYIAGEKPFVIRFDKDKIIAAEPLVFQTLPENDINAPTPAYSIRMAYSIPKGCLYQDGRCEMENGECKMCNVNFNRQE